MLVRMRSTSLSVIGSFTNLIQFDGRAIGQSLKIAFKNLSILAAAPFQLNSRSNSSSVITGTPKLLGLGQLAAGFFAGHEVVGVLRDARGGVAAVAGDELFDLVAAVFLQACR